MKTHITSILRGMVSLGILTLIFTVLGCKKSSTPIPVPVNASIGGTYAVTLTQGSINRGTSYYTIPPNADSANATFIFNTDATFSYKDNAGSKVGTWIYSGSELVVKDNAGNKIFDGNVESLTTTGFVYDEIPLNFDNARYTLVKK